MKLFFHLTLFTCTLGFSYSLQAQSPAWKPRYDSAKIYFNQGNYQRSSQILETLIPEVEKQYSDTAQFIEMNYALGMSYFKTKKINESEKYFLRVTQYYTAHPAVPLDGKYLNSAIQLGTIYYSRRQYIQAEGYFYMSCKVLAKAKGEKSSEYLSLLNNLGNTEYQLKEYHKADSVFGKLASIKQEVYGSRSKEYAAVLMSLAMVNKSEGLYSKAEEEYKTAGAIYKDSLGTSSVEYINSQNNLGHLYLLQKKYKDAETLFRQHETTLASLPQYKTEYMFCLNVLVQLLNSTGRYSEAETYQKKLLETLKSSSPTSSEYIEAEVQLGLIYKNMNRYADAEKVLDDALALSAQSGKNTPAYAEALSARARLYRQTGQYLKAEELYKECESIYPSIFGKDHPDYAALLNNMGLLYEETGRYDLAEQYYLQSLSATAYTLGIEHTEYATSLSNLGLLYQDMGRYTEAENKFNQALEIRKKLLGQKHPDYAASINNLAILYEIMGRLPEAEKLHQESLLILKSLYGENNYDYALSLNNLASLYEEQDNLEKAAEYYTQSLQILKNSAGTSHPDYMATLNNFALVYVKQGKYTEAEQLFKQYLEVIKQTLGTTHPNYAKGLCNLGGLYENMGKYKEAEALYLEALEIRRTTLGEQHPDMARMYTDLGQLYTCMKRMPEAETYWIKAMDHYLFQVRTYFPSMSENEKNQFYATTRTTQEQFYSFAVIRAESNPGIVSRMFDYQLATKAILMNASDKLRRTILNSGDQTLISLYLEWKNEKELLANIYSLPKQEQLNLGIKPDSLWKKINELEKQLVAKSALFKTNSGTLQYTWKDVVQKSNGAYVCEVVRFRKYAFEKGANTSDSIFYAVLYLTPANSATGPGMLLLRNGKAMETKYVTYYKNLIRARLLDQQSYKVFWQPLKEKILGNVTSTTAILYFSPDGVYNQISLNTLYNTSTKQHLLDEIDLHLVTSARDLIERKTQLPAGTPNTIVLVGDPLFNGNGTSNSGIVPLPGTHKEITSIQQIMTTAKWTAITLEQGNASEEMIKEKVHNPRVLHIATHGFFEPDVTKENTEEKIQVTSDNNNIQKPLLRSGLLLAYTTHNISGQSNGRKEDGTMTAMEAMNLDLDNTELVVLSACETGLGKVVNGEGVFGLQRAFMTAGARCIIISLWKVNDEATHQLYSTFYTEWVKTGNKRLAFQSAQKQLRMKYPEAYYWGAFIMIGE